MTALLEKALSWLKSYFVRSNRVHLRIEPATSTQELVHLIDRFADGPLNYEMEWDDFISWTSDVPVIEEVRLRLGRSELKLFSTSEADRLEYCNLAIMERNKIAALIGIPNRDLKQSL